MPDFNDFIKENNGAQLKQFLHELSDIKFEKIITGLILAANKSAWNCASVLLDYANEIPVNDINNKNLENFIFELGKVLMIAVKENQTYIVKSLLSFHILGHSQKDLSIECRKLFYRKKNYTTFSTDILRDKYKQYTVLHWAVENNNSMMCSLLLRAWHALHHLGNERHHLFKNPDYLSLLQARNSNKQTAYALAMSLDNLECIYAITDYDKWSRICAHENTDTIFKTVLYEIFNLDTSDIRVLNKKHRFYEYSELQPNEIRLKFIVQSLDEKTSFGRFYKACNFLNFEMYNRQYITLLEGDYEELTRLQIKEKEDSSEDYSTDTDKSSDNNLSTGSDDYSNHFKDYLESFGLENRLSYQIQELDLTNEEEILFKKFIDPITSKYIDIPVSLYEVVYDFETIRCLSRDPSGNEEFTLRDIQSSRKLVEKFEKVVKQLKLNREKTEALHQDTCINTTSSITTVSLFSQINNANTEIVNKEDKEIKYHFPSSSSASSS